MCVMLKIFGFSASLLFIFEPALCFIPDLRAIEDCWLLFTCVSKQTIPKIYMLINMYISTVWLKMTELYIHSINLIIGTWKTTLNTCMTVRQRRNTIRTNKKGQKIVVIQEGIKGYQILKKGTVELRKGKRTIGYPWPNVFFLAFQTKHFFYKFFEKRGASECWVHKMFRLGPASVGRTVLHTNFCNLSSISNQQ